MTGVTSLHLYITALCMDSQSKVRRSSLCFNTFIIGVVSLSILIQRYKNTNNGFCVSIGECSLKCEDEVTRVTKKLVSHISILCYITIELTMKWWFRMDFDEYDTVDTGGCDNYQDEYTTFTIDPAN